jgi:hypothetical protein
VRGDYRIVKTFYGFALLGDNFNFDGTVKSPYL